MRTILLAALCLLATALAAPVASADGVTLFESYGPKSGCYVVLRLEGHPDRGVECYEDAPGPGFLLVPFYTCGYKQASPDEAYYAACYTFGPDDGNGPCWLSAAADSESPVYAVGCARGEATCLLTERMGETEYAYLCVPVQPL